MSYLLTSGVRRRASFDALLVRLGDCETTLSESELLRASHWEGGEDARLREDPRFRQSPWARWMRAQDLLINDALHRELHARRQSDAALTPALEAIGAHFGRRCVFCPGDPRFVLQGDDVRLAASELSKQPVIEDDVGDLEKYTTHLPIHSLRAAAASEPAGEWGPGAQEQMIETLGWIRISARRRLNSRMFVAQIEGHSMDDGRSGLVDGGYAIFELWPSGTKPLLSVLVRGSFRDPETGSYAVKKYVADERDEEGHHQQISLVSLNPDKERYPDIELQVEDEEALAVVAKVIHPLSASDYARRPKPLRRRGRRDLDNEDALQKVHERLSARATRFFESEPPPPEGADDKPDTSAWNSQLVCLDAGAGGPHLEVGPLVGLWKFVKLLVARAATGESKQTLASNARLRPVRVPVLPSDGAWTWGADGFEDDPDVDLSSLDITGIPHDHVSAFRCGADGVGRLLSGNRLSPGQEYRLLVPPEVWESVDCSLPTSALEDRWQLLELALPSEPHPDLVQDLEQLGFILGDVVPSLSFGLASWPEEWRSTARGEGFAAFAVAGDDANVSVFVTVEGYDAEVDGEARLFLHGPDGSQRLSLPAGDSATVELSGLTVGQYFCSMLHQRTRVQPAHLPFEVCAQLAPPPSAVWTLTAGSATVVGQPNTATLGWHGDLASLRPEDLSLAGPPGWAARVLWREVASEYLATLALDEAGQLDPAGLLKVTGERRQRRRHGDLLIDLAELGQGLLEHERRPDLERARETIERLLDSPQRGAVAQQPGAFVQWFTYWHVPICSVLGYEAEWVEPDSESPPPIHAAVARLLVTERGADRIERSCGRVLVMLDALKEEPSIEALAWIDRACRKHKVRTAILTTGIQWSEHRLNQRIPHVLWHLPAIVGDDAEFIAFLRDCAEGI